MKNTKRSLLTSILSLLLCVSMLVGSTFAWFTDSVTSRNNKIQSGNLVMDLELLDKDTGEWNSIKESQDPIFNYALWEPGYTDVKVLKIENEGSLALKWVAEINSTTELSKLAEAIDVYVCPSEQELSYPGNRTLDGYTKVGTLAEFANTIKQTTNGHLLANEAEYLGIALKMQESAGNEYQDLDLGGNVDIIIRAAQYTYEKDSFDEKYDENAEYGLTEVEQNSVAIVNGVYFADLASAIAEAAATNSEIKLNKNIKLSEPLEVPSTLIINGNGNTITRDEGFAGVMLNVAANAQLTLKDVVVDGGAVWTGEVNPTLQRGTVNTGISATGAIINALNNSKIVLEEGAVLQNNAGANAVNLGTRIGATLTVNGGEIINNYSAAGAIWGGGEITLNSGKISYNHGGVGGAIRVVTNIGTVLTMNGGEMNHNYSDGVGGAIWAGSSKSNNVYVLNGGEMAYNYSPSAGGAMYVGYYETLKIGGDFKMYGNSSPQYGAIRFHNHASFVMTGGEIYDNGDNSIFLYNNSASITGGKITDDFGYGGGLSLTWGEAEVDGVITYNLSTNHNTAFLAEEFNTLKFKVVEGTSNFDNFNFKPAAGYVYTAGDENKLICMNDGYTTYWTGSVFKIKK